MPSLGTLVLWVEVNVRLALALAHEAAHGLHFLLSTRQLHVLHHLPAAVAATTLVHLALLPKTGKTSLVHRLSFSGCGPGPGYASTAGPSLLHPHRQTTGCEMPPYSL